MTRLSTGLLLPLAVAAALAAAPRAARACGRGGGGYPSSGVIIGVTMLAVGAADLGFILTDLGSAVASHQLSRGYGVVETLVAAPQLVLGLGILGSSGGNRYAAVYTLWMAYLTGHGLWTIATAPNGDRSLQGSDPPGQPAHGERPALQLGIGPTYVPVGQLAQTGFGVVGRF